MLDFGGRDISGLSGWNMSDFGGRDMSECGG